MWVEISAGHGVNCCIHSITVDQSDAPDALGANGLNGLGAFVTGARVGLQAEIHRWPSPMNKAAAGTGLSYARSMAMDELALAAAERSNATLPKHGKGSSASASPRRPRVKPAQPSAA